MHAPAGPRRHLEIANYPPPFDGWSTHTKFVVDEIRRRGHVCQVLKINENRRVRSPEYVDVQSGIDYLIKVIQFAALGYSINAHVNAESRKGYLIALAAVIVGRIFLRKATITFHGGVPQSHFPAPRSTLWHWKFQALFRLCSGILCDSDEIKRAIANYGIQPAKISTAAGFSIRNLNYKEVGLGEDLESFLRTHDPTLFCYLSFRPEYRLEVLRDGMKQFRVSHPRAGFVWLGFPKNEIDAARSYVAAFLPEERESLLVLGNLSHDAFLTLLTRCDVFLRTPACDGVSASLLEAVALGVPVVASENGRRPAGVITYAEMDAADMCRKLRGLMQSPRSTVIPQFHPDAGEDSVTATADWLVGRFHNSSGKNQVIAAP